MQPQKGICTPLALEQLQSKHFLSWMLSLGKDRLREFLGRMYNLKRDDVVERMTTSIMAFQMKNESQTGMSTNSKYSSWSGSFTNGLRKATFGKLDVFKKGLDSYLGMPSFNVKLQMHREHCLSNDSHTMFAPPNNPGIITCLAWEWDYVANYDATKDYPGGDERTGAHTH